MIGNKEELIKKITPKSQQYRFVRKWILNKYTLTIFIFLIWMIFFDNTSFLVINDLNKEINKYEEQLQYYKSEYEKNDGYYKKLMSNREEKQKFARENYFMKKPNEEIFIIVADSTKSSKK
ncbi:MAG: septum formation initiator family protein [Bacteroidetes bacterium]|jgi:cell division protein FtsB|nr:septum formation initiator family protein [Bacteroidota bacterium]